MLSAAQNQALPEPEAFPWAGLETLYNLRNLPITWRQILGDYFPAFDSLCLQTSDRLADFFPCAACHCMHKIVSSTLPPHTFEPIPRLLGDRSVLAAASPNPILARCSCQPPRCPDLQLDLDDVTLVDLNWSRLNRAIANALGFDYQPSHIDLPKTVPFATYSADALPVFITIQHATLFLRSVIAELVARFHHPFILLAPSGQFMDTPCHELLEKVQAGFFPLQSILRLTLDGALVPTRAPGEIFARFRPEPHDSSTQEAAARKFWAMARELQTTVKFRKAPLFSVFLLRAEGLTVKQLARKFHCAESLIYPRLRLLRQKLGRDPIQLTQYSDYFEAMEESLRDERAPRLYRKGAIDPTEDSDDSDY